MNAASSVTTQDSLINSYYLIEDSLQSWDSFSPSFFLSQLHAINLVLTSLPDLPLLNAVHYLFQSYFLYSSVL
ncbi:hypothetical protein POPTR_016G040401v4 [Populus trichocarpa]|uniref:Uncharacterized protein n=1 Tax=Populus trichocarpa TaxID=3694 RepID=A0ACC0RU74_POPTR|nr:hypothetical protein BDE02_16G040200 [Populus trichocarpa]KAI9380140.1 hypothetical protein POPTR_016G040401v4 [Populus trichocarpa]